MFKLFILLFTLTTLLFSANPIAYATLGNKIYNNVDNIKKLTTIGDYYLQVDDINKYIVKVNTTKQFGYSLDENSPVEVRKKYLQSLRNLSKENDKYKRMAQKSLDDSIQNGDSLLFIKIVNSGLIDTKANKKRIFNYYLAHSNEINATGVIQTYLDKSRELTRRRNAMRQRRLSKKMLEEEKIKRLRKRDKARQAAFKRKLDREAKKQKEEILKSI